MAKRKTKNKDSFIARLLGGSKKKSAKKKKNAEPKKIAFLKLLGLLLTLSLVGGTGWGFKVMDDYVSNTVRANQSSEAFLVLADKPFWVNHKLENRIFDESRRGVSHLALDQNSADIVAQNLKQNMEWLDPETIRVQTKHNAIEISGSYRKPVVLLNIAGKDYYVDEKLSLLSYVPMQDIVVVEVKNFDKPDNPVPGLCWRQDDIASAIVLAKMLNAMDQRRDLAKPLLTEIAYIDVKDFGSRNVKKSQLTLVTKDNKLIFWGAPPGKASVNLEADESEKLEKIYSYYEQFGTLQGVKYIDPRVPERNLPLP